MVVATDGSQVANAAIRFAKGMAQRDAWAPQAITIIEPLPISVADVAVGPPAPVYQQAVSESLIGLVRRQLRRSGGAGWKLLVDFGRIAPSIVRVAREQGAELVVLGLGRHGRLARWVGAETAARVARHASVPVIAVDGAARKLPRTAIAAVDFGASSVRAAREALALLQPGGRLHLLHVGWAMDGNSARDAHWEDTYALGVERGFERLLAQLRERGGDQRVAITTEFRRGPIIETTLAAAGELDADVIALGSHSQNIVDRMVIGFTPAAILRAARCSVLIAPPDGQG